MLFSPRLGDSQKFLKSITSCDVIKRTHMKLDAGNTYTICGHSASHFVRSYIYLEYAIWVKHQICVEKFFLNVSMVTKKSENTYFLSKRGYKRRFGGVLCLTALTTHMQWVTYVPTLICPCLLYAHCTDCKTS